MLVSSKSYKETMGFDKYKVLKFQPKRKDYFLCILLREKNFVALEFQLTPRICCHKPHKDRKKEYRKFIPKFGINDLVDPGKFQNESHLEKKTVFSHYTSGSMRVLKII